jgi:mannose-6-phosphate isomerase-like protein (cupin superfamily)
MKGAVLTMSVSKENAEHYVWGQNCDGWYLVKQENLTIIHERMPPQTIEDRHYHKVAWQFFFILSGHAVMEIDGVLNDLLPQQSVSVSPNTPHQMRNPFDGDLEFLLYSQPPAQNDRFPADPLA